MKKVKIGKDDVILLDEDKLPRKVKVHEFACPEWYSLGKIYDVVGITWDVYADRTRALAYILINDKNILETHIASHFEVI